MYVCSKERMEDKIKTFSKFGDAGHGGITRYSLSPEAIMARNEFLKRMKAIGAEIEIDDVANIYATLPGSDPDAKRIVMASHVDSVKNGGNYDGILGVMSAMEVLETVVEKKIPHKHPLTAMISVLLTVFWECSITDLNFTVRQLTQAHSRCQNVVMHFMQQLWLLTICIQKLTSLA